MAPDLQAGTPRVSRMGAQASTILSIQERDTFIVATAEQALAFVVVQDTANRARVGNVVLLNCQDVVIFADFVLLWRMQLTRRKCTERPTYGGMAAIVGFLGRTEMLPCSNPTKSLCVCSWRKRAVTADGMPCEIDGQ
jgi:hypothetical protein